MAKRDYYEVLGVERGADAKALKAAYRKLAMQFHPDRNPGDTTAEEKFKEANEAYGILSDDGKRARYDQFGHDGLRGAGGGGFDPSGFPDFADIFGDIFGFGGQTQGGRTRARRGADLQYDLEIDFEDAIFGLNTEIQFPRTEECEECEGSGAEKGTTTAQCRRCAGKGQVHFQQGFFSISRTCPECQGNGQVIRNPCKQCRGTGNTRKTRKVKINIPAGVDTGTRLRLTGEGESGGNGGPPGDLYVLLRVREHAVFERDETDLYCEVPVNIAQAALGAEIEVPSLEGGEELKIPAGAQTGQEFPIRNKGVPDVRGNGRRGDLVVRLKVVVPKKLSKEQREHFEALLELLPADNTPHEKGIFEKVKDYFA